MNLGFKRVRYLFFLLLLFFLNYSFILADDYGLSKAGQQAGINTDQGNFSVVVGEIMGVILSFLGMIFFILLVYGGFMWMISQGNETKVEKAKKIINNSLWGLVIILMAYVISNLIISSFSSVISS